MDIELSVFTFPFLTFCQFSTFKVLFVCYCLHTLDACIYIIIENNIPEFDAMLIHSIASTRAKTFIFQLQLIIIH